MMETIIQKVAIPEGKRVLVLSDPHAHMEGFSSLLARANFTQNDILIIVGDILERGLNSLGLLRQIMSLSKDHTVYTMMGNVDYRRLIDITSNNEKEQIALVALSLNARKWWGSSFFEELLHEVGLELTEDLDRSAVFPLLQSHFKEELSFIAARPTVLETQNKIFVHGGIPHENLDELKPKNCHQFLKLDHFLTYDVSFKKTVIVGHWPVTLYSDSFPNARPYYDKRKNVLSIDGGCGVKKEGQINLLIFPSITSKDYELLTWDGLPVVNALDAQQESTDFSYIRWGDDEVTLLESNTQTARILYHGRSMTISAKGLYQKDGVWHAGEITDYHLPVSPGDALSVIKETSSGLYAKKNGITGWYMGRYEYPKSI